MRGRVLSLATGDDVPPFLEADGPVVVGVDLGEEHVQLAVGNGQRRAAERELELLPGYLPVAVAIDALEER